MKYYKQAFVIIAITFIAEILAYLIPLPIPASVYGMIILFSGLLSGKIHLNQVEGAGEWLIAVMPAMFIVPAAGFILSWTSLQPYLFSWLVTILSTTIIIMVVTGLVAQYLTRNKVTEKISEDLTRKGDENNS